MRTWSASHALMDCRTCFQALHRTPYNKCIAYSPCITHTVWREIFVVAVLVGIFLRPHEEHVLQKVCKSRKFFGIAEVSNIYVHSCRCLISVGTADQHSRELVLQRYQTVFLVVVNRLLHTTVLHMTWKGAHFGFINWGANIKQQQKIKLLHTITTQLDLTREFPEAHTNGNTENCFFGGMFSVLDGITFLTEAHYFKPF